jgi:xylulokinase
VFDALEQSAVLRPAVIQHSGGGAASDLWCQIRADILNRTISRTAIRDAGVLGAALMAGIGCGMFGSLQQAANSFVQIDRSFEPQRDKVARHDQRFEQYKQLYLQLVPFNRG